MSSTTSKGIVYPTSGDQIAPLETVFVNMAESIDANFSGTENPDFTGTLTAETVEADVVVSPKFKGDIYAGNGTSVVLDNGSDGTDAVFTGDVTGDVTGNVTGNVSGKAGKLAGGTAMSLPYQSAADTTAFLAAGTSGNVLQTNGTGSVPSWVTPGYLVFDDASARDAAITVPTEGQSAYLKDQNTITTYLGSAWYPVAGQLPYIQLVKNATQGFTSGASGVVVTWPTPTVNRGGFTIATNVVTVPVTGLYNIDVAIYWAGNASGARLTKIIINGTEVTRSLYATGSALSYTAASTYTAPLTAGDTVSVEAYQNSSASPLNVQADLTRLTISYVSP